MEIEGKIIQALPEQGGTSQRSGQPWRKKIYLLETKENFPRKIAFDFFGDKIDQYPLEVGQEIILFFDIESREYNGRFYTDVHGWRAELAQVEGQTPTSAPTSGPGPVPPMPPVVPQDSSEDLPF